MSYAFLKFSRKLKESSQIFPVTENVDFTIHRGNPSFTNNFRINRLTQKKKTLGKKENGFLLKSPLKLRHDINPMYQL